MGISRRKFLKGLVAAPIVVSLGGLITDESVASLDKYFTQLKFDPNQMFRHAVSVHGWKVVPLEGVGVSGSNKLIGNEEQLSYYKWTEDEAFEEGKRILWDYINWKIPKRYHKRITFVSDWDDHHNEFGVGFCYHPIKCKCGMEVCFGNRRI